MTNPKKSDPSYHLSPLSCRRSETAWTFTLIELLIVIAIIAILAAMLLPALNNVRERAKSMTCISNIKTFGFSVIAYCDNYNDFMPRAGTYKVDGYGFWHQAFAALKLINAPVPTSKKSHKIFLCPSEPMERIGTTVDSVWNTYKGTAYGMNRYLSVSYAAGASGSESTPYEYRKITQAKWTSQTCSIGDKWIHPTIPSPAVQAEIRPRYYVPGERHNGKWNYATLDGGVKSLKGYPKKGASWDYGDVLWAPTPWK